MPSKYSHSVVLAQQSSCGLISLPNDQYIDYLRSSPLLATKPPLQKLTTVPSKNRARATSTKSVRSERPITRNSLRQQSSMDQLAAGAYQHQYSDVRLHGRSRRLILDLEDVHDPESSHIERPSEAGRTSNAASSIESSDTNLRPKGFPQRLPVEVHQQIAQNLIYPPIPQRSPQRVEQKAVRRLIPEPEPEVRPSIELPIQRPNDRRIPPARRPGLAALTHNRNISISKSLATPQLSPTGTEMTGQYDSPTTPFLSLQYGSTTALAEEQRDSHSRDKSSFSQHTAVFRPPHTKLPSTANFDHFGDDIESGDSYFNELPESDQARQVRLANMRAYNVMENAINELSKKENIGSNKNLPAARNGDLDLRLPLQPCHRDRTDSLSSSSSSSDIGFGIFSVSQTTGKLKTSAVVMRAESPIPAHQALPAQKKQPTFSRARASNQPLAVPKTKPTPPPSNLLWLPSIRDDSPFKRQFDPSFLDPTASTTTPTLSEFLSGLESRFSAPASDDGADADTDAACPPPDIARYPTYVPDPLTQLIIDSRGGVMSITPGQAQERKEKGGVFNSLRLKKRR